MARLLTQVLLALLVTCTVAVAAPQALDHIKRDVDCAHCHGMYDFCAKNGHTPGQTGCLTTCREHVCAKDPGCKTCGDPFDKCPDHPRWHN
ncbi:hypothetical protein ACN47E_007452 [Coniothyrium glycines]